MKITATVDELLNHFPNLEVMSAIVNKKLKSI